MEKLLTDFALNVGKQDKALLLQAEKAIAAAKAEILGEVKEESNSLEKLAKLINDEGFEKVDVGQPEGFDNTTHYILTENCSIKHRKTGVIINGQTYKIKARPWTKDDILEDGDIYRLTDYSIEFNSLRSTVDGEYIYPSIRGFDFSTATLEDINAKHLKITYTSSGRENAEDKGWIKGVEKVFELQHFDYPIHKVKFAGVKSDFSGQYRFIFENMPEGFLDEVWHANVDWNCKIINKSTGEEVEHLVTNKYGQRGLIARTLLAVNNQINFSFDPGEYTLVFSASEPVKLAKFKEAVLIENPNLTVDIVIS